MVAGQQSSWTCLHHDSGLGHSTICILSGTTKNLHALQRVIDTNNNSQLLSLVYHFALISLHLAVHFPPAGETVNLPSAGETVNLPPAGETVNLSLVSARKKNFASMTPLPCFKHAQHRISDRSSFRNLF